MPKSLGEEIIKHEISFAMVQKVRGGKNRARIAKFNFWQTLLVPLIPQDVCANAH